MKDPILNILIIDDNPDDLEFYTELLGRPTGDYSYEVFLAEDANAGLSIFKENKIDCTFIDFNMPEDDGLAVIDMLQDLSGHEQIPMVVLTGEPHQRVQADAARHGAMDYIRKDSIKSIEDLEKVIDKVIVWAKSINNKR